MADLSCAWCGLPLSPGQPTCRCGTPVPRGRRRAASPRSGEPPRPVDGDRPVARTRASADDASRLPADQPDSALPQGDCTHEHLPPGVPLCDCGTFLGNATPQAQPARDLGSVVLTLPWGTHRLDPGEQLEIGRDVGPFRHHLTHYTHVSRRHATLRLSAGGVLLVQDHASMNGTFLDGTRCPPTGTTEVPDGSEIGCGSTLMIQVRFEP